MANPYQTPSEKERHSNSLALLLTGLALPSVYTTIIHIMDVMWDSEMVAKLDAAFGIVFLVGACCVVASFRRITFAMRVVVFLVAAFALVIIDVCVLSFLSRLDLLAVP